MINNDLYFLTYISAAKELVEAEKSGASLEKFNFSVNEVCAGCLQNIYPPKKVLRCSACKAALYCSAECAKRDWNHSARPKFNGRPHKEICADNKRHMEKLPLTQAIVKSFPWGRLESDGSFNFDIGRARFGVLGASGYGFWSHRGGPRNHSEQGVKGEHNSPYESEVKKILTAFNHLDGKDLLEKKHLSDQEGWKLSSKFIPYRNFTSPEMRPVLVTEFEGGVVNWDSWYRWRGLTKESPAALLMNYPLSVYQLIVNCLQLTSPKAGRPEKRVALHIHLLGVEVELDCLPLFSEIALLLPYHDIKLVLFGAAVSKLVEEAKKVLGCLASKSPVFTYTAPSECGSGTISIHLHSPSAPSALWSAEGGPNDSALTAHGGRPDALVACNAGLGSYREWWPVIQAVYLHRIPFATTEYAEQSAEHQRDIILTFLLYRMRAYPMQRDEYEIRMNPFQRPGQRSIPMYRLPNVVNGFTLVVYKGKGKKGTGSGGEGVKLGQGVDAAENALEGLSLNEVY